ncbi:MAG: hypothetical protein A4E57_00151 [Syntrophorhabdaceae bacterium PtaU1.Bin034]|nr:MAG: hypothetical protein A4E57_00151 [Syntrophorhabdaceae bacterium PtaU1.Bin034]
MRIESRERWITVNLRGRIFFCLSLYIVLYNVGKHLRGTVSGRSCMAVESEWPPGPADKNIDFDAPGAKRTGVPLKPLYSGRTGSHIYSVVALFLSCLFLIVSWMSTLLRRSRAAWRVNAGRNGKWARISIR